MDLCMPSLTRAHLHTYTCIHTLHRHMHTRAAMHAQSHIHVCANNLPLSCIHALTSAHTFYNGDIYCESREGRKWHGKSSCGICPIHFVPWFETFFDWMMWLQCFISRKSFELEFWCSLEMCILLYPCPCDLKPQHPGWGNHLTSKPQAQRPEFDTQYSHKKGPCLKN